MNNKPRRILAIIGIIILVGLYLTTLLLAIFGNEHTNSWFMACIAATIIVPIMLWVYSWLYKMLKKDVSDSGKKQDL
ncbi:MAG: hypothetical protein IJ106_10650 [Parasporobacterium sp.]|nr:hypothetical protein [Parasporobacterium sp.]